RRCGAPFPWVRPARGAAIPALPWRPWAEAAPRSTPGTVARPTFGEELGVYGFSDDRYPARSQATAARDTRPAERPTNAVPGSGYKGPMQTHTPRLTQFSHGAG